MAHSSTESMEDHNEDHGEYHNQDHGEYHDEDHGEYEDEDDGESDDEEYGEYDLDEDDGEYHAGEHGEYTTYEVSELKIGGPSALFQNAIRAPGLKLTEFSAKSGETIGVARARVAEQFSKAGASVNYGVYSATHPFHPIRRVAAKEAKDQKKILAGDRRKLRVARAHLRAAAKIARAREGHIQTLEEGVH